MIQISKSRAVTTVAAFLLEGKKAQRSVESDLSHKRRTIDDDFQFRQ